MRVSSLIAIAVLGAGFAVAAAPANASSICPATGSTPDPSVYPSTGSCNLVITFNGDGSIVTAGPGGNYDGSDDAVIGVVNNSGSTLNSFVISSTANIFGFEVDGIDTFITNFAATTGNPDNTGYGGPDGYFTGISNSNGLNTGTVNFVNGIANGATDFFSLEESINVSAPPTFTPAPEPVSLALLGTGLIGIAANRRRRRA